MSYSKESYFPQFAIRWTRIGAETDSQGVYDEVVRAYAEPHRGHHNLQHILECQSMLDEFESKFQDSLAASLAFLFHDVVYDPKRNDNEEKSAMYFISVAQKANISEAAVQPIAELIRLSKPGSKLVTNDQRYFHDIDCSVLGSGWSRYLEYAKGIEKEYLTVFSLSEYARGRADFLSGLLQKERIFETQEFHQLFDTRARENAKREIELLQAV